MAFPLTLLDLAGCVALLLWGIHMVQTGVQRAFGPRLRSVLATALRGRVKSMLAGIGVTAILQSSTATGLMVSGFAAGGLVDLVPALAVMLGANIGTTLIVQVLSFDVSAVSPALILIGVMMFRRGSESRTRDVGRVLIGLGLVLLSLRQVLDVITPYADAPSLRMMLGAISTQPVLDVVLAAGLTWAAHSSVTVVLLVMSFAARGVVPPDAAFALVLGANLGTAINPVLEGGAGDDPVARRLPMGNLINRVIGVVAALIALPWIGRGMVVLEPDSARAVADFHTLFNLVLAAVFFPLLDPFARAAAGAAAGAGERGRPVPSALSRQCRARDAGGGARRRRARGAAARRRAGDDAARAARRARAQRPQAARRDEAARRRARQAQHGDQGLSHRDRRGIAHRGRPPARCAPSCAFATNMEHAGDVVERNLLAACEQEAQARPRLLAGRPGRAARACWTG